jgi:hypothetical protein
MGDATAGEPVLHTEWWDEDEGVLRFTWAPGVVCGAREARSSTDAIEALGLGAVPLLIDMRGLKKLEREARTHYSAHKAGVCAFALLVGSPVTRMLANFFMATDPDGTESAALGWLREQP